MSAGDGPAQRATRRRRHLGDGQFAVILTLPGIALFIAVVMYPLIASLFASLFEQSLVIPGRSFVGLENFRDIADDLGPLLKTTLVFTLGATVLPFVIGFALALALNTGIRGRRVLTSVFLFPWVMPSVVVSFLWMWIFNANYGVLNGVLQSAGIVEGPTAWLAGPNSAMIAVIIAKAWASFPWIMVMLLAGLQTVPAELQEAATVDGAGTIQRFRAVTVPHLRGVIAIVLMLEFIWNFQHFDTIYVLTGGGPAGSTTTFSVAVYETAFDGFDLGRAGALGAVWMVMLLAFVAVYLKIAERSDEA